jgi:uncharacterized protein involved in tellurium resistance
VTARALVRVLDVPLPAGTAGMVLRTDATARSPDAPELLALLLEGAGRLAGGDAVSRGAPAHASGAVRWRLAASGEPALELDLLRIPEHLHRVVVVLLAPGGVLPTYRPRLEIVGATGVPLWTITGAAAGAVCREPLFVAVEIYRWNGGWWLRGVGYGLDSPAALLRRFGDGPTEPLRAWLDTRLAGSTAAGSGPATTRLLAGQQAAVARTGRPVTVTLHWLRKTKDLDLYALYVDRNGRPGACYYRNLGSLEQPPFICHTSGDRRGRETIAIARPDALRYVLVCAYSAVENGIGAFKGFHARAEVDNGAGQRIEVPLGYPNAYSYWVAIALIDLTDRDLVAVRHVETYSRPTSEARPVLYPDGRFVMDRGSVEFKTR